MSDKKKVIVYGIGKMWNKMRRTIESTCEIIGFADKYVSIANREDVFPPEEILEKEYDYVLVTPIGKMSIYNELKNYGIESDKIIPYYGENSLFHLADEKISYTEEGVKVSCSEFQLLLSTKSDDAVFKEVFIDREYDVSLQSDYAVIDIGMNIGLTSIFYALNDSVKKIYGFEPFKKTYDSAIRNISKCKYKDKIETYNVGLSNEDNMLNLQYDENDSESMSIVCENVGGRSEEVIQVRDAASVLEELINKERLNNRRILCKMDCEGSEYDIFSSFHSKNLLNQFDIFLIEWHLNDNDYICKLLQENDFTVMKSYDYANMGKIRAWK